MPNPTQIINALELPKNAAGQTYIPNGLDPAQVSGTAGSGQVGTGPASTWADGPMSNWPPGAPPTSGALLHSFPDRPSTERQACTAGQAVVEYVSPATAVHASAVVLTLTGSRFTGATAVAFTGGAGTAVTVVNDSTLRVTTPATGTAAGASTIAVTTPAGASPAYTGLFSFT